MLRFLKIDAIWIIKGIVTSPNSLQIVNICLSQILKGKH